MTLLKFDEKLVTNLSLKLIFISNVFSLTFHRLFLTWQYLKTMRFLSTIILLFLIISQSNAQFYYLDILSTKQTNQQYRLLRNFQIKKISATSYDDDEVSKDFVLEQTIDKEGTQIVTRTASINNQESFLISHYNLNRIIQTVDSSKNATNTVDYSYDNTGKIISISSNSTDFDGTFSNAERHIWTYNEKGQPEKMLKIRNGIDSTFITFTYGADDNLSEEKWYKKGQLIEKYYYYHNEKKQLTDIVRFNVKADKLIPDLMFEYDNGGRITQMTQTQSGIANYIVWKYSYNENGLKEQELVYGKKHELLGKILYKYW